MSLQPFVINQVLVTQVCPKLCFYSDSNSDNSEGHRKGSELVYFWNSRFQKSSDEILAQLEGHQNLEGATKERMFLLLAHLPVHHDDFLCETWTPSGPAVPHFFPDACQISTGCNVVYLTVFST